MIAAYRPFSKDAIGEHWHDDAGVLDSKAIRSAVILLFSLSGTSTKAFRKFQG